MPTFNRDALRKGYKAIDEAIEQAEARRNRGEFKPFLPSIYWRDDKDFRYVLFLNPIEESPKVNFHPFIDLGDDRPHSIMARTDPSIGERTDPIHDQWNYKPRDTNLAIAVELEPTITIVDGREKPTGFEVATRTFERAIRDDEGNATEEYEEVTVPLVGLVAQSPHNFFNHLRSYDATEAPVHATPMKITRHGKQDNVNYQIVGYETVSVDLTNLVDYIENLSYVAEPEELLESIVKMDDADAAALIGEYLLYKQIEEFADEDAYNALLKQITKPARFGDTKKTKKEKVVRQARPSQRRSRKEPEAEVEVEAEPAKAVSEKKVTKSSSAEERLARLKEKSRAARKAA